MAKLQIRLTPDQQKFLVVGVVTLGAFGFIYFKYFWSPVSKRIAAAQTEVSEVDGKIQKAQGQAARLEKIQTELDRLNQQTADAEKRLPKSKDVPAVLLTLSRLSRSSRVELLSFAPGGSSAKPFFIEVPYTITLSGGYHDIGRFLASLVLEERIFNMTNIGYTLAPAADKPNALTVSLTLISYQYKG